MGYLAYLNDESADNYALSATLSASSASSVYAVANLQAQPISFGWRPTALTAQYIDIDLGSAKAVDLVALVAHNLSATATLTLNGGTTTGPTGGEYTTSMTWREGTAFKLLAADETYRYWRIEIDDASNADSAIQIGYLMVGNAVRLGFGFEFGWRLSTEAKNRETRLELGGSIVNGYIVERTTVELPFNELSLTDATTLRSWLIALRGSKIPVLVIPDQDENEAFYSRLRTPVSRQAPSHGEWSFGSVTFEEEPRGSVLVA